MIGINEDNMVFTGKKRKRKYSGSLTVETSLALPIFLFASLALISILGFMSTYIKVEYALHETARELAILSFPANNLTVDENVITDLALSETLVRGIFNSKYKSSDLSKSFIDGGISFYRCNLDLDKGIIDLTVTYKVRPMLDVLGIGKMTLSNRCKVHAWVGYKGESDKDEEYVYITDDSEVYHTHSSCSHLRLEINVVNREDINLYRNYKSGIYKPCEKCQTNEVSDYLYITPYGDRYHTRLSCPGLKRTVYKVKKSEVHRRECEKCAGYRAGEITEENIGEY